MQAARDRTAIEGEQALIESRRFGSAQPSEERERQAGGQEGDEGPGAAYDTSEVASRRGARRRGSVSGTRHGCQSAQCDARMRQHADRRRRAPAGRRPRPAPSACPRIPSRAEAPDARAWGSITATTAPPPPAARRAGAAEAAATALAFSSAVSSRLRPCRAFPALIRERRVGLDLFAGHATLPAPGPLVRGGERPLERESARMRSGGLVSSSCVVVFGRPAAEALEVEGGILLLPHRRLAR